MDEISLKILLIGDSFVGKTSLLLKYCDGQFPEAHMATIGVEFKDKIINVGKWKVRLQIWDTSGQERFRSITQNFYRNADGILFVYDVTNRESFSHIKDWLMDSQVEDSDIKRILVGNKIDLEDKRAIDAEKMNSFAESKKMKCYETSAKSGENVENIFKEISLLILENKTDDEILDQFSKNMPNVSISTVKTNSSLTKKRRCC